MTKKKIIVIGASTSSRSINKQLARLAADQLNDQETVHIDINDYEMPLYSIDKEQSAGIPQKAHDFYTLFSDYDGLLLSVAEHNRNICAGFKNILDWTSRINVNIFREKPVLLMSTSPGGFGGKNARNAMENMFALLKGQVVSTFSLPHFKENFSDGDITGEEHVTALKEAVHIFRNHL